MKVALICPSNIIFMPYVKNYMEIFKDNHIKFDLILWDRFNIEEENEFQRIGSRYLPCWGFSLAPRHKLHLFSPFSLLNA